MAGDVFGRIYEYFLAEFSKQGAHDNGEFYTPPSIVQTIVNVIEPEHGIVLDAACGTGGTRDDGTIDGSGLEAWIKEARILAKAAGRGDIADSQIGQMLSASPMGTDGAWPAEPVRDVLDLFRSKPMIEGFEVGKANRRGVTTRAPRDGGALERHEVSKYRAWARQWPTSIPTLRRRSTTWPSGMSGRPDGTTKTPSDWIGKPRFPSGPGWRDAAWQGPNLIHR